MTAATAAATTLAQREGFQPPGTEEFFYDCYSWSQGWKLLGLSACMNRVTVLMLVAAAIVVVLFVAAFRRPQVVPRGLQNVVEVGVDFVRNQIILDTIGPKGLRFLPYLTSLFFFIFFANVFGILPFVNFPVTSRMAIPALLAVLSWVVFVTAGMREQGVGRYLRNNLFPPGIPWPIYLLVTPIEFVSTFLVRPVTLAIRLVANMIAGHLLLTVLFVATAYMIEPLLHGEIEPITVWSLGAFALGVALTAFELLVAGLQAYIFTILNAVYLAGALEPEH